MGYVVLLYNHEEEQDLAIQSRYALEQRGIRTWLRDPKIDWDRPENAHLLKQVIHSSHALILISSDPHSQAFSLARLNEFAKPVFLVDSPNENFSALADNLIKISSPASDFSPLPILRPDDEMPAPNQIRRWHWRRVLLFLFLILAIIETFLLLNRLEILTFANSAIFSP